MHRQLNSGIKALLALLFLTTGVVAQADEIEEIVVQATKRGDTALMSTPITINVVTGEDLQFREIRNPEDLRTAVSGVYIDEGSSTPKITIRGVGFDNFQVQAENGVTTYVDGVIIQRTHAVLGGFLDYGQVEVLKGPQGSAFGRNATGGAINFITNKPQSGVSGEVSVGAGSFGHLEGGFVLNNGGDEFGIRLAGSYSDADEGYVDNIATGANDLNAREETLARLSMAWDPSDNFSLDYSFSYSDYDFKGPGQDHTNPGSSAAAAGLGLFVLGLTPLTATPTGIVDDDYSVVNSIDPRTKRELNMHALTMEWDLGWGTFKSITGYIDFDNSWRSDVGLPSGFVEGMVRVRFDNVDSDQFSQEFLLSGETDNLNWVVGAYYLNEEAEADTEFDLSIGAPALPVGSYFAINNGQELTSFAVFADGQYSLSDDWRLNAGIRWTDDEKEAFGPPTMTHFPFGLVVPNGPPVDGLKIADDEITWQLGLEYDLSEDVFTYIRIADGYKAGGINNNDGTMYEPEELLSWEIGAKGNLGDNISYSAALFYSDYEKIQLFINPPDAPGSSSIINAAEATISGIDLDLDWQMSEAWSLDLQVTWLAEAEYDDFVAFDGIIGALTDFSGEDLNRSPDFTGILGLNWENSITDNVTIRARAEVYKTSEIVYSFLYGNRADGALSQDGYELVNLFVTATIDENLDIRVYAKNIGDEFYLSSASEGVPGFQVGQHGRPDEYGVELTYRF